MQIALRLRLSYNRRMSAVATTSLEKQLTPLPWEWFDFAPPPEASSPDFPGLQVSTGTVLMDHRPVPYRVIEMAGDSHRPKLMLMHGMGLNIATFHGIAAYLLATHDLIMPDYTSFSLPHAWPHGGVSVKVMAETVCRVADALKIERLALAGNSLGGGMCLMAALQHPDRIGKLVLTNPACYPQELPWMYRLTRVPIVGELFMTLSPADRFIAGIEFIGYVDKSRFVLPLRQRYRAQLSHRASRYRLMDMIRHLPGNERDLSFAVHVRRLCEITQPVLLLWGMNDPLLDPESGPRLAKDLPNCRFITFADLGHMPHEEAPERVGPIIAGFLNG